MGKILCFLGFHQWSKWLLHEAYGDRQYRYCLRRCGKREKIGEYKCQTNAPKPIHNTT